MKKLVLAAMLMLGWGLAHGGDPVKPTATGTIIRMGTASYIEQRFWGLDKPRGFVILGKKGQDRYDCICLMDRDSVPAGTEVGQVVKMEGSSERIIPSSGVRLIDGCYLEPIKK